jgi:hypothetical protein
MGQGRQAPDDRGAASKQEADDRADEADRESFPASDAPAGWSGRDDPAGPSRDEADDL